MYLTEQNSSEINEDKRSDEEILAISLKNPSFFEVLVSRYEGALLRKAKSILHSEEEAEDVVQDAFVKAYINAGKFKKVEGASFKSWIYKILINTCFTKYQKLKKEKKYTHDLDPEIAELVTDKYHVKNYDEKLDTDYLLSLISKLPNLLRKPVTMHFIEGKAQKDIARSEGVSENVIRTRIHRAKKFLKKMTVDINY